MIWTLATPWHWVMWCALSTGGLSSGAVFTSPPSPMLAQLDARLPRGERWAYEPKMDGFRGLLWRRDGATQLLSRSGRDLGPWFPELITAAESLPCNTLVDGEIVIADESGQADFGALQQRLTLARKFIGQAVAARAAILLVFDVLELEGEELTTFPLSDRRRALEQLLAHGHCYLQVVSHTLDVHVAEAWLGVPGLEGVVAKRVGRDLNETFFNSRWQAEMNLRWVCVHMIEEYARHNGHAELLRERLDGMTGA
jgi:ATP-dependent DNA ligase